MSSGQLQTELPTCHWAPLPQPLEERWTVGRACWSNVAVRPSDEPPLLPGQPESQSHRGYTCAAGDSVYPGPRCMPCCFLQKNRAFQPPVFYVGNQAKDKVTINSQKLPLVPVALVDETVTTLNIRRQEFPQRSETLVATLRQNGHAATSSQLPK